jgi:hypothetical protein
MEPITQEMRDTAFSLERMADAHIQVKRGHRFVDVETREKAVILLSRFEQEFPSRQDFNNYSIGPRFTWKMLKSFAEKMFAAISAST